MGIHYRIGRRTGVSIPGWLALPAAAVWVTLAMLYLAFWVTMVLAALLLRLGEIGYRAWRARRSS